MIITIDGPAASGKSTIARLLARSLNYSYLNSGFLYRALAYLLACGHEHPEQLPTHVSSEMVSAVLRELEYTIDAKGSPCVLYRGENIARFLKTPSVDTFASVLALNSTVRDLLVDYQRVWAVSHDIVADGRDCGTVVFPHADYKFFLTASETVRAERWRQDQEQRGVFVSLADSEKAICERDKRDLSRAIAPLKPAHDAVIIDNSHLTLQETLGVFLERLEK